MKTSNPVKPLTEDYSSITEVPGSGATKEQLARLYNRYHTAAQYAANKRVLEVACGSGTGLGYLAQPASQVVGADYTASLLKVAQTHYQTRLPLLQLDAQQLPFEDHSFDLVIIFEAIYYLPNAAHFIAEARRVLDTNGVLLIGSVNKDWSEFAPSPFSTKYFSVPELNTLLADQGFIDREFYGAFPIKANSAKQIITSLIRKMVVTLDLMPKSLEGRAKFKRLFYGSLAPLPAEVDETFAVNQPLHPLVGDTPTSDFTIIYSLGRCP